MGDDLKSQQRLANYWQRHHRFYEEHEKYNDDNEDTPEQRAASHFAQLPWRVLEDYDDDAEADGDDKPPLQYIPNWRLRTGFQACGNRCCRNLPVTLTFDLPKMMDLETSLKQDSVIGWIGWGDRERYVGCGMGHCLKLLQGWADDIQSTAKKEQVSAARQGSERPNEVYLANHGYFFSIYQLRNHVKTHHPSVFDQLASRQGISYDQDVKYGSLRDFFKPISITLSGNYICVPCRERRGDLAFRRDDSWFEEFKTFTVAGWNQHSRDHHGWSFPDAALNELEHRLFTPVTDRRYNAPGFYDPHAQTQVPDADEATEVSFDAYEPRTREILDLGYMPMPDIDPALLEDPAAYQPVNRRALLTLFKRGLLKVTTGSDDAELEVKQKFTRPRDAPNTYRAIRRNQQWKRVRSAGSGTYGSCSVWALYNKQTANIEDHIVMKDILNASRIQHPDIELSVKPPYLESLEGRVLPTEGVLAGRMTQQAREKYSILTHWAKCFGSHNTVSRIYMEFAPFASLWELYTQQDGWEFIWPNLFPEDLVWQILYSLVHAVKTMNTGIARRTAEDEESRQAQDWEPFLHRDLKLDNIMLVPARDRTSREKEFPTVAVTDYGLAIRNEYDGDPSNFSPEDFRKYQGLGTMGYMAPELVFQDGVISFERDGDLPTQERGFPDPKIDIYSIGIVCYCLMMRDFDRPDEWAKMFVAESTPSTAELERLNLHEEYSKELRELVKRCIIDRPSQRIGLDDLLREAKAGRDHWSGPRQFWQHGLGPKHGRLGVDGVFLNLEWATGITLSGVVARRKPQPVPRARLNRVGKKRPSFKYY